MGTVKITTPVVPGPLSDSSDTDDRGGSRFAKFVSAESSIRSDGWVSVDALLEAVRCDEYGAPIHGEFQAAADAVAADGGTISQVAVSQKFHAGRWVNAAQNKARLHLVSRGWLWSHRALHAGWTQEQLAAHIEAGGTRADVKKAAKVLTIDEEWLDWFNAMNSLLAKGHALASATDTDTVILGTQSALGYSIYKMIAEKFIDAELREMVEAAT